MKYGKDSHWYIVDPNKSSVATHLLVIYIKHKILLPAVFLAVSTQPFKADFIGVCKNSVLLLVSDNIKNKFLSLRIIDPEFNKT